MKKLSHLLLVLTFLIATISPLSAREPVHLRYEFSSDQPVENINCWFDREGLLIQFNHREEGGDQVKYLLYNTSEETGYALMGNKSGFSISRAKVEQIVSDLEEQYQQMEERLADLPPSQQKMLRQRMSGMTVENPRETRNEIEVKFQGVETTNWHGLVAKKGHWTSKGTGSPETTYEAIVLQDPPVEVTDSNLRGIREAKKLVEELSVLLRSLGPRVDESMTSARRKNHLIHSWFLSKDNQLQLVEVREGDEVKFELIDWGRNASPLPAFKPPAEYEIESAGEGLSDPGQG